MKVIGLTGSIGMGKSTVAKQFALCGGVVSDADKLVHGLMAPHGLAFAPIAKAFPNVIEDHKINRQALGAIVFHDAVALKQLEAILHPLVRQSHHQAISHAYKERRPFIVLEIPLLFETGAEILCDAVAVVSAPYFMQRRRVLAREGMTETKFQAILAKQMPDVEKRRRADVVIPTSLGKAYSLRKVKQFLAGF